MGWQVYMSKKVFFCAQAVSPWGFWCSWETFGFWRGEAFRISGGTWHTWGIPSNLQTENTEIPEICNKKESSNYLNNLSSTTDPLHYSAHCIVPHRGGDEQNQHNKQREEKRGKKAAPVLLSHIVSAWIFGTWGIYTLVVDVESTYLGGVYQWSSWLMA